MLQTQMHKDISQIPFSVDAFLERDPVTNNIPLGVLIQMRSRPQAFRDYHVFVVENQQNVHGYAHHVAPYPLIIGHGSDEAVLSLARSLRSMDYQVSSIHGPGPLVGSFAKAWPELFARESYREHQGLYRLDKVLFPTKTGAKFGLACMQDLPLLVAWHKSFCHELGDVLTSDDAIEDMQRSRIQAGDLFVLRSGQQIVSMASASRTAGKGRVLSFIYTPPGFRGRGYAAELTACASDHILRSGYTFCCLFTQLQNPTSNKIYQQVGYKRVREFLLVRFEDLH